MMAGVIGPLKELYRKINRSFWWLYVSPTLKRNKCVLADDAMLRKPLYGIRHFSLLLGFQCANSPTNRLLPEKVENFSETHK